MKKSRTFFNHRAVGRSKNPGVPVLLGGHNLPPLVEIGLTDLQKSGGAPPSGTTPLNYIWQGQNKMGDFFPNFCGLFRISHGGLTY